MSADVTQPTDMVGAGIVAPDPRPVNLLEALQGGSPLSQGALAGMLAPPEPNAGMTALNALGAGVFAGRGQANPIAAQQLAQQQEDRQRQMMMQRMYERSQDRKAKQQEGVLAVSQHLLNSESSQAREVGAKGVFNFLQTVDPKNPPPTALIDALSKGHVDIKKSNEILRDIAEGMDDKMILARHPYATPESLTDYRKVNMTPALMKTLGVETPEQRQSALYDLKIKEEAALAAQYPEIKGKYAQELLMAHRKLNNGQDYKNGTPESRSQAYEIAKLSVLNDEQKRDEQKLILQEGMRGRLQEQSNINAENRMLMREGLKTEAADKKRQQGLVVAETFVNQFDDYIDKLDKAGFLPKDSGVLEKGRADVKQGRVPIPGVSKPNDPVWRGWLDLQGNMIGFARSVQNDIGPRAMAAFQQAVNVSEHPPTAEGLRVISKQMREQLKASKIGEIQGPSTGPLAVPPPPPGFNPVPK